MKTLREYIDQLDEISRRDFLKGAGAAAGLAAMGSAKGITADQNGVNFTDDEYDNLRMGLLLYYFFTKGELQDLPPTALPDIKNAINRIVQLPGGKARINKAFSHYKASWDKMESQEPKTYQGLINYCRKDYLNIIRNVRGIMEFGQNPRQAQTDIAEEELDEASEESIARILELSKN